MATSSITKNFVVSGAEQVSSFADAVEESYQESLHRNDASQVKVSRLSGVKNIAEFMSKRCKTNV